MMSAVIALKAWEQCGYEGEPEGWNRAMTRNDQGGHDMFRRRPGLSKESEYIAP